MGPRRGGYRVASTDGGGRRTRVGDPSVQEDVQENKPEKGSRNGRHGGDGGRLQLPIPAGPHAQRGPRQDVARTPIQNEPKIL